MKDDANKMNPPDKSRTLAQICPNCGRPTRYLRTVQGGREQVDIYRCLGCKREFVEEELRRNSD